jgi:hypothetical protein
MESIGSDTRDDPIYPDVAFRPLAPTSTRRRAREAGSSPSASASRPTMAAARAAPGSSSSVAAAQVRPPVRGLLGPRFIDRAVVNAAPAGLEPC